VAIRAPSRTAFRRALPPRSGPLALADVLDVRSSTHSRRFGPVCCAQSAGRSLRRRVHECGAQRRCETFRTRTERSHRAHGWVALASGIASENFRRKRNLHGAADASVLLAMRDAR
jgi:hypothetical protein